MSKNVDIIVVGAGHAGIEAANIAAKYNLSVLLVTLNIDTIGQMSCNPAIGGISKGNIVREIDSLGGLMGKIIDKAGIQFRMLNKSKGLAVWGPRAQADKILYKKYSRYYIEKEKNLEIYQDLVTGLIVVGNAVCGVTTQSGQNIYAKSVILSVGTFLNGLVHIGLTSFSSGRTGEPASIKLSESIKELGIEYGRLKTGTPARIDKRTIDFTKLTIQEGDENFQPFSFSTKEKLKNRAVCWSLKTSLKTHDIIRKNLDKSPLYCGIIDSVGPRYCPSIEDKIVKFGDRKGHTLFLEPETLDGNEMYLNGFSTSLPYDVQLEMIRSLEGFERASIFRPAYAIEYDYFYPTQLYRTLESRKIENLYFTGQINGTSGYEEAACQGLIAGINAAEKITGGKEFILGRDTSYTGVLIDDLVVKGTEEPYRMFTSRAEYRLLLRQDNSDRRLTPLAMDRGLIDFDLYKELELKWKKQDQLKEKLKDMKITKSFWNDIGDGKPIKESQTAYNLLKRPSVFINNFIKDVENDVFLTVEADIKYEGFINKQIKNIEKQQAIENILIPETINYDNIEGLLTESREKLKKIKPLTLGQATRISGVTPADISILIMYINR